MKKEVNVYENLCKLLPQARSLKEDFKALQRGEITLDEWEERKETAFVQLSDRIFLSLPLQVLEMIVEKNAAQSFRR